MTNRSFITGTSPANMPGQSAPLGFPDLNDIGDVNAPSPSNNQVLSWDSATQKWVAQTVASSDLNSLLDVNAPSPSNNQVLGWDSATGRWVAVTINAEAPSDINLKDLGDVNAGSPIDNQVLRWDSGSNRWTSETLSLANIGGASINDMDDVHLPNPSVGQIMRWSGSRWEQSNTALFAAKVSGVDTSGSSTYYGKNSGGVIGFHALPTPAFTLNDLDDVSASNLSDNQLLRWNAATGRWTNVDGSVDIRDSDLDDLRNVSAANPSEGHVLRWNAAVQRWEGRLLPGGITRLSQLDDIDITNTANGDILQWNSIVSQWVSSDVVTNLTSSVAGKQDTISQQTIAPPNPVTDMLWVDTTNELLMRYDGTTWVGVGGKNVTVRKNLLINGDFSVWQRSTTYLDQPHPSVDRWRRWTSSMNLMDKTDVSDDNIGAVYAIRSRRTNAGDHGMFQRIESCRSAEATDKVTISFWAKVDSGTASLKTFVSTPSAIDNWATQSAQVNTESGTVTTSWKRFAFVLDVAARSFPASNGLSVGMACTSGTVACEFANVKVEIGEVATDFEPPHPGDNLDWCQRYYFAVTEYFAQEAYASAGGQFFSDYTLFPTTMRVIPAMSLVSESLTNCTNPGFYAIATTGFRREARSVSAGRCIISLGVYHADAEL